VEFYASRGRVIGGLLVGGIVVAILALAGAF